MRQLKLTIGFIACLFVFVTACSAQSGISKEFFGNYSSEIDMQVVTNQIQKDMTNGTFGKDTLIVSKDGKKIQSYSISSEAQGQDVRNWKIVKDSTKISKSKSMVMDKDKVFNGNDMTFVIEKNSIKQKNKNTGEMVTLYTFKNNQVKTLSNGCEINVKNARIVIKKIDENRLSLNMGGMPLMLTKI